MRNDVERQPLLGRPAAETAFLAGYKAVAADVVVILLAGAIVIAVAMRDSDFDPIHPSTWSSSVFVELAFCVVGLLGILNVVVSGSGYAGLYVGGGFWNALWINLHFYLILGAIIASDIILRIAFGGDAIRTFSNWAVMIASGASANLMAPWPFTHRQLGSIDKRLWVFLWVCYQVAECYVSLFGATDKGWLLIVLTLIARRAVFILGTAIIAKYTYGSFGRLQKLMSKAAVVPLFCPSQSVGRWHFKQAADGALSIDYELFNLDTPEPIPNSQELAAMGGGHLLKIHMLGGLAPCPLDPNPVVFLEQMISFGSPTAVIGSRAAIGHILYVAAFVSGFLQSAFSWDDFKAIEEDMSKPPAERVGDDTRVNLFRSQAAARMLMSEWLHGSRVRTIDLNDSATIAPELLQCEEQDTKA